MRPRGRRERGTSRPGDRELRAEAVALLGELTIEGAFRDRDALADMDDPSWDELVRAREELVAVAHHSREMCRAICERLSEPTRRRLALLLLDRSFLRAVARAALKRAQPGEGEQ
jgi:hypothetical protein